MTIKAIETIYPWPDGHRYRSRLEARFAVFLDLMGIDFRYEHEGFDLGGLWYLPDFWIPDSNIYIEIKEPSVMADEDIQKVIRLAKQIAQPAYICARPDVPIMTIVATPSHWTYVPSYFVHCPICRGLGFTAETFDNYVIPEVIPFWCPKCSHGKHLNVKRRQLESIFTPQFVEAATKAKQARFEHNR